MEKIVLVTGDRHNPSAHHIKLSGTVSVGRGFNCDVILNDTFVEPEQLVFHFADGVRTVEVLTGTNRVLRNGVATLPGVYPFFSGDEWSFGKTLLTAFDEQHAISPTEKKFMEELPGGIFAQGAFTLLGIFMLVGWTGLQGWLSSYKPLEWGKDFAELLTSDGHVWFVMAWSVVMGIIGRFSSGRAQFSIHLITAVLFVIVSGCFDTLTAYAAYAFNQSPVWNIINPIGSALLLAAFFIFCFSHTLNIRGMKYMALGLAICWVSLGHLGDVAKQNPLEPSYIAWVKPPFAVLVKPVSVEDFMQQANTVFTDSKDME